MRTFSAKPLSIPQVKVAIFVTALFGAVVTVSSLESTLQVCSEIGLNFRLGDPAAIDTAAFWSAVQTLYHGKSPYQSQNIFDLQQTLNGPDPNYLLIFWNPPWLLAILSPVAWLSFEKFSIAWLLLNVVFAVSVGAVMTSILGSRDTQPFWPIVASTFFLPNLSVLQFGTLGLMITLSVSLFLLFERKGADLFAGLALVPATVKPHILFLFWMVLLFWIIRERRWSILIGLCVGVGILSGYASYFYPRLLLDWVFGYQKLYDSARSPTLGSLLRTLDSSSDLLRQIAMVGVPLLSSTATAAWFIWSRPKVNWVFLFPSLAAISLITTPYSMYHDQCVLSICQCILILAAIDYSTKAPARVALIAGVVGAQLLSLVLITFIGLTFQHQYWWFPLLMLGVWHAGIRAIRTKQVLSI